VLRSRTIWLVASAALGATVAAVAVALPSTAATSAATTTVAYGWGRNLSGEAGIGPVGGSVLRPGVVTGAATGVTQIAGGYGFTVSLRSDGTVWAWGDNTYGQLGDGSTRNSFTPVQVHGLPTGVVQVAAGLTHAAAVASDGTVWSWGDNRFGDLGYATTGNTATTANRVVGAPATKQVAAGGHFTVALRTNGEVWSWGLNEQGQLGDGTHTTRTTPARNKAVYGMTQVSTGLDYALALRPGSVWSWGRNTMGQLGNGTTVPDAATPVQVDRHIQNAVKIVAGGSHAFAVDPDGSLWAWGDNTSGALGIGVIDAADGPYGHGRNVPVQPSLTGVTQLGAGSEQTIALRSDGTALVWGSDLYGLLGNGTRNNGNVPTPTAVTALSGVSGVGIGEFTLFALAPPPAPTPSPTTSSPTVDHMPDVIGMLHGPAAAELRSLGLFVTEQPVPDPDPECDNVGLVNAQFPRAGTEIHAGDSATIGYYSANKNGCP
jgi:alpha-tubulin suppressor-like RCC1 family protein